LGPRAVPRERRRLLTPNIADERAYALPLEGIDAAGLLGSTITEWNAVSSVVLSELTSFGVARLEKHDIFV
jgi:hypothetical protein